MSGGAAAFREPDDMWRDCFRTWLHGDEFHVDPACRDLLAAAGISEFRHIYKFRATGRGRDRRSVTRIEAPGPGGPRRFYLKVYRYRGWRVLRTLLRRAKAEREFENLRSVSEACAPAVRPVAYGVRRKMGFIPRSFLVTEAAEGAHDCRALIGAYGSGRPAVVPRAAFLDLLPRIADGLRDLHRRGIYLHTAYEKNLLVWMRDGAADYCWVDLPFAGRTAPDRLPMRRRVRDLACLNKGLELLLSASARLRLLRHYAGPEADPARVRDLAWAVVRYTRALRDETFWSGLVRRIKGG